MQPPLLVSHTVDSPLPLRATSRTAGARVAGDAGACPADAPSVVGRKLTDTVQSVPAGKVKGTAGQVLLSMP